MSRYKTYICGPTDCPTDPGFEHDGYFGCIPKDFNQRLGTSKTFRQHKSDDGKYRWNGGCNAVEDSIGVAARKATT